MISNTNTFEPKFGPPYCDDFEHQYNDGYDPEYWSPQTTDSKREELGHLLVIGNTYLSDLYFDDFDLRPITAYEAQSACILERLSFWKGKTVIVLWLNTLVVNRNGTLRAYRLDPESDRHAPIFEVFENWDFSPDGSNHRELYDESELPEGFYDGLEEGDLLSDAACNLLGINKIIWSAPVNVREPQKTKLKPAEEQRAYLRERGLSDLKRVVHTARARLHHIQDQAGLLAVETDFAKKCSPPKLETHACDHPPDIEPRPEPASQILKNPKTGISTAYWADNRRG